jgi:splicing factor 3A subunit 3
MLADLEEAEGEGGPAADDEEEEEYIYNPLKLPLGWDGKPIPYWLYKLHGLNQEFKCEICGNYRCGAVQYVEIREMNPLNLGRWIH